MPLGAQRLPAAAAATVILLVCANPKYDSLRPKRPEPMEECLSAHSASRRLPPPPPFFWSVRIPSTIVSVPKGWGHLC